MPKIRGIRAKPGGSRCEAFGNQAPADVHSCSDQLLLKDRAKFIPLGSVVSTLSVPLNPLWSIEKYRWPRPTLRDLAPVAGAQAVEFLKCFLSNCVNHAEILVQGLLVAPSPTSHCSSLVSYLKGPQHTQVRTDGLDLCGSDFPNKRHHFIMLTASVHI